MGLSHQTIRIWAATILHSLAATGPLMQMHFRAPPDAAVAGWYRLMSCKLSERTGLGVDLWAQ